MKMLLCCAALLALAPMQGHAANARNPYGNVNHANDAGNDTGDSRVESLNQAQLSGNPARAPGALAPGVAPANPYAAPAYGYAPPPVAYAYPPPVYYPPVYVAPRPYRYYRYGW